MIQINIVGYEKFDILSVFHDRMSFKIIITKNTGDANNPNFLSFLTIFWTIFDVF